MSPQVLAKAAGGRGPAKANAKKARAARSRVRRWRRRFLALFKRHLLSK
jgi:hypothetical protein